MLTPEECANASHIVALSGGRDSTAMALRLHEIEPHIDFEYICTPTGNELPEMVEHWLTLGKLLGRPVLPISSGKSLAGLIREQNCLPNWRMRWCTYRLKIVPFEQYILNKRPCIIYVGMRYDEVFREGGVKYNMYNGMEHRYPLLEWQWDRSDVISYLKIQGVTIPERTDCGACFFQTLWEWYMLWKKYPERFAEAAEWERLTGHTLRSEQRDTWPASLDLLGAEFAAGRSPRKRTTMHDRKIMCSVCAR